MSLPPAMMLSLPWLFCACGRDVQWMRSAMAYVGVDADMDQGWPMPIVSRVTVTTLSRVASAPARFPMQISGLGP